MLALQVSLNCCSYSTVGQSRDNALCLAQVLHCFPKLLLTCIIKSGKEGLPGLVVGMVG